MERIRFGKNQKDLSLRQEPLVLRTAGFDDGNGTTFLRSREELEDTVAEGSHLGRLVYVCEDREESLVIPCELTPNYGHRFVIHEDAVILVSDAMYVPRDGIARDHGRSWGATDVLVEDGFDKEIIRYPSGVLFPVGREMGYLVGNVGQNAKDSLRESIGIEPMADAPFLLQFNYLRKTLVVHTVNGAGAWVRKELTDSGQLQEVIGSVQGVFGYDEKIIRDLTDIVKTGKVSSGRFEITASVHTPLENRSDLQKEILAEYGRDVPLGIARSMIELVVKRDSLRGLKSKGNSLELYDLKGNPIKKEEVYYDEETGERRVRDTTTGLHDPEYRERLEQRLSELIKDSLALFPPEERVFHLTWYSLVVPRLVSAIVQDERLVNRIYEDDIFGLFKMCTDWYLNPREVHRTHFRVGYGGSEYYTPRVPAYLVPPLNVIKDIRYLGRRLGVQAAFETIYEAADQRGISRESIALLIRDRLKEYYSKGKEYHEYLRPDIRDLPEEEIIDHIIRTVQEVDYPKHDFKALTERDSFDVVPVGHLLESVFPILYMEMFGIRPNIEDILERFHIPTEPPTLVVFNGAEAAIAINKMDPLRVRMTRDTVQIVLREFVQRYGHARVIFQNDKPLADVSPQDVLVLQYINDLVQAHPDLSADADAQLAGFAAHHRKNGVQAVFGMLPHRAYAALHPLFFGDATRTSDPTQKLSTDGLMEPIEPSRWNVTFQGPPEAIFGVYRKIWQKYANRDHLLQWLRERKKLHEFDLAKAGQNVLRVAELLHDAELGKSEGEALYLVAQNLFAHSEEVLNVVQESIASAEPIKNLKGANKKIDKVQGSDLVEDIRVLVIAAELISGKRQQESPQGCLKKVVGKMYGSVGLVTSRFFPVINRIDARTDDFGEWQSFVDDLSYSSPSETLSDIEQLEERIRVEKDKRIRTRASISEAVKINNRQALVEAIESGDVDPLFEPQSLEVEVKVGHVPVYYRFGESEPQLVGLLHDMGAETYEDWYATIRNSAVDRYRRIKGTAAAFAAQATAPDSDVDLSEFAERIVEEGRLEHLSKVMEQEGIRVQQLFHDFFQREVDNQLTMDDVKKAYLTRRRRIVERITKNVLGLQGEAAKSMRKQVRTQVDGVILPRIVSRASGAVLEDLKVGWAKAEHGLREIELMGLFVNADPGREQDVSGFYHQVRESARNNRRLYEQ